MSESEIMGATPLQLQAHAAHLARRRRLWAAGKRSPLQGEQAPEQEAVPHGVPVNLLAHPSPKTIIKLVALKHGVARVDVVGPPRTRPIVAARHEAIGLIYTHCKHYSLPELGRFFGNRDHTTMLHAMRKLKLTGPTQSINRNVPSRVHSTVAPPKPCEHLEDRHFSEAVE